MLDPPPPGSVLYPFADRGSIGSSQPCRVEAELRRQSGGSNPVRVAQASSNVLQPCRRRCAFGSDHLVQE